LRSVRHRSPTVRVGSSGQWRPLLPVCPRKLPPVQVGNQLRGDIGGFGGSGLGLVLLDATNGRCCPESDRDEQSG
jgi:hypothetical protein